MLEGTAPWELPEALMGGLRLDKLDLAAAKKVRKVKPACKINK